MFKLRNLLTLLLIVTLALGVGGMKQVAKAQDISGDLEIFSWWTGGGEEAGLNALIAKFKEMYPNVKVINSAVAGGSGVNARAVLTTRMEGGNPPGTFQVHAGAELNTLWVAAGKMESLNDLYEANGWMQDFPKGLLDLISADGNIYSVPVNIHRSNVLWYIPANLEKWGVTVPETWDAFISDTCPKLQAAGVTPIAVAETWTQIHLWENVAISVLGADGWKGLWDGTTAWDGPEMTKVFETFGKVLDCANTDMTALTWQDASKMVAEGKAAFNVMGDWAAGYFLVDLKLSAGDGFGWAPAPGTAGIFNMLSDTFGLPKGAPNQDAVKAWLTFLGSAEAQDIFNPLKGSLPANTKADITNPKLYNAYFQSAYKDWTSNTIVGSLAHGAVAPAEFSNGFSTIIADFQANKDVATAVATAAELAASTLSK